MTIEISPHELQELLEQLLRQATTRRPKRHQTYKLLVDAKTLNESWKSNGWSRTRN